MTSSSVLVRFREPPELEAIHAIEHVTGIEELEQQQYRICHRQDSNISEKIAILAVDKQWGLLELIPEKHDMEHIFLSITQDSNHHE
jgi:ABC-2 type transport system ATP-binding protein